MKISPMAQGGNPGASLNSVSVGRTATAEKLNKAKAIAAGETPTEAPQEQAQPQEQPNVNRIKLRVNRTIDRDMAVALEAAQQDGAAMPPATTQDSQSSAPPATEQAAVEATQPLSPQLAAIAKARRALQLERAEFEKTKTAFEAGKPKEGSFVDIERLKSQPLSVLRELGALTPDFYNQAAELVMQGDSSISPEFHQMKQRIQELETQLDKKLNERDQQARSQAEAAIEREAKGLAASGEEFELIRETQSIPQVMALITRTYDETGELMDTAEAMRLVEEDILEQQKKLLGTKKLGAQPQEQTPNVPAQRQLRTLTSQGGAMANLSPKQRAILAFQGQLKR